VSLASDGLQPEHGQATLSVVRALARQGVWFAEAWLASAPAEGQQQLAQARGWAERLGTPVRLGLSENQEACVRGIAAAFPEVPQRDGTKQCRRDVAQPVWEAARRANVKRRRPLRGWRAIAREVLAAQRALLPPRSARWRGPAQRRPRPRLPLRPRPATSSWRSARPRGAASTTLKEGRGIPPASVWRQPSARCGRRASGIWRRQKGGGAGATRPFGGRQRPGAQPRAGRPRGGAAPGGGGAGDPRPPRSDQGLVCPAAGPVSGVPETVATER
jgi:hypothetical protein